jgi:hypothetical protein
MWPQFSPSWLSTLAWLDLPLAICCLAHQLPPLSKKIKQHEENRKYYIAASCHISLIRKHSWLRRLSIKLGLFTLKVSPHHTTCFDQYSHHQVFENVHQNCCASVLDSIFSTWPCLCTWVYHRDWLLRNKDTQHNRNNNPPLNDTQMQTGTHTRNWSYETGSTAVSINNNFKHLMMTILVKACSTIWGNF